MTAGSYENAHFFDEKVKNIVENTTIGENVYNGEQKIHSNNKIYTILTAFGVRSTQTLVKIYNKPSWA